jgi:hypothetical protein
MENPSIPTENGHWKQSVGFPEKGHKMLIFEKYAEINVFSHRTGIPSPGSPEISSSVPGEKLLNIPAEQLEIADSLDEPAQYFLTCKSHIDLPVSGKLDMGVFKSIRMHGSGNLQTRSQPFWSDLHTGHGTSAFRKRAGRYLLSGREP